MKNIKRLLRNFDRKYRKTVDIFKKFRKFFENLENF